MGHSHGHTHGHAAGRAGDRRRLRIVLAVTLSVMALEIVGGLLTGSLALLADAGHMATDAGAVVLALGASYVASLRGGPRSTFGLHRAEILAALAAVRDRAPLDRPDWAGEFARLDLPASSPLALARPIAFRPDGERRGSDLGVVLTLDPAGSHVLAYSRGPDGRWLPPVTVAPDSTPLAVGP